MTTLITNIQSRYAARWTAGLAAIAILTLACNSKAADKGGPKGGGGTTTKDLPIDTRFWLDDFHTGFGGIPGSMGNGVVADGNSYTTDPTLPASTVEPSYTHGQEYVSAQVMPDRNINVHLASQYKKTPVRHFILNGGFPADVPAEWTTPPLGVASASDRPVFLGTLIPISMFQIYGQNHDDTPPGIIRYGNARLVIRDDAGRTWTVYYGSRANFEGFQYSPDGSCMAVERLRNTPSGTARWRFWTEGQTIVTPEGQIVENQHLGYLYVFQGNPTTEVFAGVVNLPMSGTFESLNAEPEPPAQGYVIPEVPAECP